MTEFLQQNSEFVASILTAALVMLALLVRDQLRSVKLEQVESKIRDLTPDEYEAAVMRYTIAVYQALTAAGQDLTDDKIRKQAAVLVDALIQIMLFDQPVTKYLDKLFELLGLNLPMTLVVKSTDDIQAGMGSIKINPTIIGHSTTSDEGVPE